jgi:hypothetical protein
MNISPAKRDHGFGCDKSPCIFVLAAIAFSPFMPANFIHLINPSLTLFPPFFLNKIVQICIACWPCGIWDSRLIFPPNSADNSCGQSHFVLVEDEVEFGLAEMAQKFVNNSLEFLLNFKVELFELIRFSQNRNKMAQ